MEEHSQFPSEGLPEKQAYAGNRQNSCVEEKRYTQYNSRAAESMRNSLGGLAREFHHKLKGSSSSANEIDHPKGRYKEPVILFDKTHLKNSIRFLIFFLG